MPKLADWVKETVTGTPGTGTVTLGGAVAGFCRFQDNFTTGDKVYYSIEDGNNREEGYGTLTSGSPWTLARTTPTRTISSGVFNNAAPSAISLTSAAIVGIAGSADTTGIIVGTAYATLSTNVTCTALISMGTSKPQISEGTQLLTCTYVPKFPDSIIQVKAVFNVSKPDDTAATRFTGALFKDNNTDAIAAEIAFAGYARNGGAYYSMVYSETPFQIYHEEVSGSTTSRTYKIRGGPNATGTFYAGSSSNSSIILGGIRRSYMKITEVRQ